MTGMNIWLVIVLLCIGVTQGTLKPKSSHYQARSGPPPGEHCYRTVGRCVPLNTSQCLDITLPYKFTSVSDFDQEVIGSNINQTLERWKVFRSIPHCWKVLQKALCASFLPRCEEQNSKVLLPTHEICRSIRGPCRIIDQHFRWPDFLRCDNQSLFPSGCRNEYTDIKFGSIAANKCTLPLVDTTDPKLYYTGFDGCALQCMNPVYSLEQHEQVSGFIYYCVLASLAFTGFTVATFFIDWRVFQRYPAKVIFFINFCLLVATIGWFLQFFKGRSEVVCRADNTIRYGENSLKHDNFYCVFSFFIIYYFSLSALIWFVHLAYVFDRMYHDADSNRRVLKSKTMYFHMTAWCIPLVLTVLVLIIGEIDGNSLYGICFVGFQKPLVRVIFGFFPMTVGAILSMFYMSRAVIRLFMVKRINDKNATAHSAKKSVKIKCMIVRIIGCCSAIIVVFVFTVVVYWVEVYNATFHDKTLYDLLICNLNASLVVTPKNEGDSSSTRVMSVSSSYDDNYSSETFADDEVSACRIHQPPTLSLIYLQLVAIFATSIIASSWVWTRNTQASWKRFYEQRFSDRKVNAVRVKPYETIAKCYARREQMQQGIYLPSFASNHNDPVDMDLNSALSETLSHTFQANLGALMDRRHAVVGSEMMNMMRHMTTTARLAANSVSDCSVAQHSFESVESESLSIREQRRRSKKERKRLLKRRGSDTSGSLFVLPSQSLPKSSRDNKSTSTGDLLTMLYAHAMALQQQQQQQHQSHQQSGGVNPVIAPPTVPFNPFLLPTPMMTPSIIPAPLAPPVEAPPPARVRMTDSQKASSFTFTHGMTDQALPGKSGPTLVNPLEERRRPDSSASGVISSPNMALTTMNANQAILPQYPPPHTATPFYPPAQFMPRFYNTYLAQLYDAQMQQQTKSLMELEALAKERQYYRSLISPMQSDSECGGDLLPIQISDSDSIYSRNSISRGGYRNEIYETKRLVEARIQQVEDQVESEVDDTTVSVSKSHDEQTALKEKHNNNKKNDQKNSKKKKKDK